MAKLIDIPLSTDFSALPSLVSNGIFDTGLNLRNGIPDHVEIVGGAARLKLYRTDDAEQYNLRTELKFGAFPNGTGEYWSKLDFKYDWDYTGYVAIGSWYATPDAGDGTKYVPIGYRIRNHCLVIQVPVGLPAETLNFKTVATVPIVRNQWHVLCTHVNLQTDNTGFREIFLDGAPILREFNIPTTYFDAVGPYLKMGPYDGAREKLLDAVTFYLRNVTMWSGNDGYQAVMGSVPRTPRRLLQP